jgi:hypothetical protein
MADAEAAPDNDAKTSPVYEICLQGYLDDSRAQWFCGMSLTHDEQGNTILRGPVVDQAALYGLLERIRDLGVALVSVNRVNSQQNVW